MGSNTKSLSLMHLAMAVTSSFQLRIAYRLKHWIVDFLRFEMVYSMHQLNFRKCSKSAQEDYNYCSLFSSLCFSSLHCSFLAYFERLWQRAMELQSFVLHEFEIPKALPWTIYSSPSFLDCFGDQKVIKTPKLNTIWSELIARVLNMLIGLKGNNYYSKVFKRVNYKLSNSTFWVVISGHAPIWNSDNIKQFKNPHIAHQIFYHRE